jgi:hypothetical protein
MEYEEIIVGHKRVFICEEHHHVLKFWQQFKDLKPYVLTLDHHTDLNLAYQHELYSRDKQSNYANKEELTAYKSQLLREVSEGNFEAIKKLKHDEHIDTAVKSGIVRKVLVHAKDSYMSRPSNVYSINGDEDYAGQLIINNPRNYQDPDLAINSKQLKDSFLLFDRCIPREEWLGNFILDIDLDYFMTTKAIRPKDSTFFKMLIKKALVISIAKESHWVGVWQREHDVLLTVDYLLEELFKLIESASEEL